MGAVRDHACMDNYKGEITSRIVVPRTYACVRVFLVITFVNDVAQVFKSRVHHGYGNFHIPVLYVVVMQEVLLARLRSDWRVRCQRTTFGLGRAVLIKSFFLLEPN